MRIVSGIYGGRKLQVPDGRDIRPTSDKVRSAVFNMLQARNAISGSYVLDGFCGTGALGFEALSRGADHCSFFDMSRVSLSLAQENAQILSAQDQCSFFSKDITKIGARGEAQQAFDLVFLDPPYHKSLVPVAMQRLAEQGWLSDQAWVVCETEKNAHIPSVTGFECDSEKTYGQIYITLFQYTQMP
ncbi:MAG: 16S rRNA (guanine(966)-N(2))-methyltransferase RsmD [Alphaproteobacteria bacterium]